MTGMSSTTGKRLEGLDHIKQCVKDILSTPIGTRVMRRDYGSMLPDLLDQPINEATLLRAYAATVIAVMMWEPRLRISAVRRRLDKSMPGRAVVEIEGSTQTGSPVHWEIIL